MYKFSFEKPSDTETDEDVVIHNLRTADDAHNLQYFTMSQLGWFKLYNNNTTYYDFEIFLRENNFNTHLFAHKLSVDVEKKDKFHLAYPNTKIDDEINKQLKYECFYSCRPKKYALDEVLQNWKSYEENLNALKISGHICISDESKKDIFTKKDIIFSENEINVSELIGENKLKIIAKYVSIQDSLNDIISDIKERTGKTPSPKLIAMHQDGSPIYALVVDKQIMSNIGYCIRYVKNDDGKDEQAISLFNLNNLYDNMNEAHTC